MIVLGKFHPETFLKTIEKYKPTKMIMVPFLVMFMIKTQLSEKYDLSSIKQWICGSAPISKESIETFLKKFPGTKFHQMYGLTETSAICIYNHSQENVGSIGHVMPEVELKIVDGEGKLLGPNEMGELYIRGSGITKGYYKNEKGTKESFDDEGFFKTGDIGYYDEKHFLYIIDRIKDIITHKGFQVSPSEIEHVLLLHEGVQDAGVIGIPDERAGEVALAFIVLNQRHKVSEEELHTFVSEYLSIAKHLHGGIRFIAAIPRNPFGKVDRKVLRSIVANNSS